MLTPLCSGKAESITITNEKGRLSQEEIDRMVREAEEFASEDEAQRKRIEALNNLSNFVFGLKNQLGDQEGLGGKVRALPLVFMSSTDTACSSTTPTRRSSRRSSRRPPTGSTPRAAPRRPRSSRRSSPRSRRPSARSRARSTRALVARPAARPTRRPDAATTSCKRLAVLEQGWMGAVVGRRAGMWWSTQKRVGSSFLSLSLFSEHTIKNLYITASPAGCLLRVHVCGVRFALTLT